MSPQNIVCPKCGQNDRLMKVSIIFLEGIGASGKQRWLKSIAGLKNSQAPLQSLEVVPPEELPALSRIFTPPMSGKASPTRPIHPDMVLLVFSLVLPVFLYGIYSSQRDLFFPVLLFLLVSAGLYAWRRKTLVARFEREQEARREKTRRVERAIGRWMRSYYCARDEVVFEAGLPAWKPVDEIDDLLFKQ